MANINEYSALDEDFMSLKSGEIVVGYYSFVIKLKLCAIYKLFSNYKICN